MGELRRFVKKKTIHLNISNFPKEFLNSNILPIYTMVIYYCMRHIYIRIIFELQLYNYWPIANGKRERRTNMSHMYLTNL